MIKLLTKDEAEMLSCPFMFNNPDLNIVGVCCISENCHGWEYVAENTPPHEAQKDFCAAIRGNK